ncbi:hypothetical protein TWF569_001545 [Orbilia oligospora]|nr:hypothetical protein TWF569_001545 [Orbilia oligospora]
MRNKQFPLATTALWFWAMFSICFGSETVPHAHNSTLVRRAELTRLPRNRWAIGSPRRACRVGLYMYRNSGTSEKCSMWEGIPLSTDEQYGNLPFLDGICYRLTELDPELNPSSLASASVTVIVQGYCNCIIYSDDVCGRGPKPEDVKSYPTHNMIWSKNGIIAGSIQCFQDSGWESFESCSVKLSDGITYPSIFETDDRGLIKWEWEYNYLLGAEFSKYTLNRRTGESECITIGGISLRSWEIEGCTCHLYTDESCQKRYITFGGKGVRRVEDFQPQRGDPQKIRSVRCDLPWTYDPMEDVSFHRSICTNLHPSGQFPNYQIKPFK